MQLYKQPGKVFMTCAVGGGVETYARNTCRALAAAGWEMGLIRITPGVVTPDINRDGNLTKYTIGYGNLHWRLPRIIPSLRCLGDVIRGWDVACAIYKLVKSENKSGIPLIETFEGVCLTGAHRKNSAICLGLHSNAFAWKENLGEPLSPQDKWAMRFEKLQLAKADRIRAQTRSYPDYLEKTLGITLNNIDILPYILDESLFLTSSESRQSDDIKILHVGRPDLRKGAQYIIQAIPEIVSANPKTRFHFAGWKADDPEVISYLKDLPEPIKQRHITLRGWVAGEDLLRLYDMADICVIPSLWDCSPNTVYEALARGCAVVGTRVGGIPEQIGSEGAGIIIEPKSSAEIASAVIQLVTDISLLNQTKINARSRAMRLFHPSVVIPMQIDFYRRAWEKASIR